MPPDVPLAGIAFFLLGLFLHIALWRVRKPENDLYGLALTFFLLPWTAALLLGFTPVFSGLGLVDWFEVLLLHFVLSAAYIASYPAAQAISPSLDIVLIVGRSPEGALSGREIETRYSGNALVGSRFEDLISDGLIGPCPGEPKRYRLKKRSRLLVSIFRCYRGLLGLPMGRG